MNYKNKKWNQEAKNFQTKMNHMKIEDYRRFISRYDNDLEKTKRLNERNCKVCYYKSRLALQAFTNTNCGLCDIHMVFSNSDTDTLCENCSIENDVCKHCGGEID